VPVGPRSARHDAAVARVFGKFVDSMTMPPLMLISACIMRLPSCAGMRVFSLAPKAFW
jgi:hypothetical protein